MEQLDRTQPVVAAYDSGVNSTAMIIGCVDKEIENGDQSAV